MNHDDFETKLRALTGALKRPDPTPGWKQDILARARREAEALPAPRRMPPRALVLAWAAAWAAIAFLHFETPRTADRQDPSTLATTLPVEKGDSSTAFMNTTQALIAFQNFNTDLQ